MAENNPKVIRTIRGKTMEIDRSLCIGAATCVALAPRAWTLDDDAKACILDSAEDEDDQTLLEAAQSCPVAAIIITDENGKRLV